MATNINVLVSSVLQIISDLRGESSVNTDASRIRAVSRANQDFALRRFWKFYLLPNQTKVGDGTNDYSISVTNYPMRFKGLIEVFVDSGTTTQEAYRHQIVDFNVYKKLYNENNSDLLVYEWYDKANDAWKMHINPAPAATDTITYSYYWVPPTLTATTDYCLCPNPKIIALLASADIHIGEDEVDVADKEKNEAEQLINEVIGVDNAPAQNQTYGTPVIEGKGLGNY
jgi:hypothetical protein